MFQCLRISSGLFPRWSSYPVHKTVLFCKFCRSIVTTSSNTGPSPRVAGNSSPLQRSGPSLPREPRADLICRQHWKLAWRIANLPEHRGVRRILAWNHLCDADLLEGGHALKSKRFVNTKADGHGWKRRNLTNHGLDDFLEFFFDVFFARCEEGRVYTKQCI